MKDVLPNFTLLKIACKTRFNIQNAFKFMIDIFQISILHNTRLDSGYR